MERDILTYEGINQRSKYATQVQQRPESPTVTLTWRACKYKVHKLHQRYIQRNTKTIVSRTVSPPPPTRLLPIFQHPPLHPWPMLLILVPERRDCCFIKYVCVIAQGRAFRVFMWRVFEFYAESSH